MKVLVIGSGGREHALAWKIRQSPRVSRLWVAPGNAGTAQVAENVAIRAEDVPTLVQFAHAQQVDLVVIGPEASLAAGISDALAQAGIRAFGPSRAAAQIETSKAFSKAFMQRWGIPTARFAAFTRYEEALAYLEQAVTPVVIKASGLAAGKGVILPASLAEARAALHSLMVERAFGAAGECVVIEERLEGEEVSLMAFTDGRTLRVMPPAQDHKRLNDQDQGPNTGGMGAYAPAPVCTAALLNEATRTILQPAVDGLRREGTPFVGALYAGLIITPGGLRALEFNSRFGDPETQVILPLLETDLLDVLEACVEGQLDAAPLHWRERCAVTVVAAAPGYPEQPVTGQTIHGLEAASTPPHGASVTVFHAGTRLEKGQVVAAGGRVLNVTAEGATLEEALACAYDTLQGIHFAGMQYRRDIAQKALRPGSPSAYAAAGVDIDAGGRAVALMRSAVQSTYTQSVLSGIGAFGGLFDAAAVQAMQRPVLVASTDGVGTKVRLGVQAGRLEALGMDIVNHCINDILVQGARPLFFLDYFATASLSPEMVAEVVAGMAAACRAGGCALLGGETAEMPGVYAPGEFDIAGTIVGLVERDQVLPRGGLQAGDLLVGLASSGPHTNGYSLIRRVFATTPLHTVFPDLGVPLADALLAPHRSYLQALAPALDASPSPVKALAHLTGGGFLENIPRVLPEGLRAVIHTGSWEVPPLFRRIQAMGKIETAEMYRVFNMGIGMVAVIAPEQASAFQQIVGEPAWIIGALEAGPTGVELR
jgi:phosphoribosylamine--glycine ligase/phosphoribosylformylglycinamidine cyclo-ligase